MLHYKLWKDKKNLSMWLYIAFIYVFTYREYRSF